MQTTVPLAAVREVIEGSTCDPTGLLGPHHIEYQGRSAASIRAFLPDAKRAWIVDGAHQKPRPMRRLHRAGFFEGICASEAAAMEGRYRLRIEKTNGEMVTMQDPYAVAPMLSDFDRYLLGEGKHYKLYEKLGAQPREVNGTSGVNFAVWAPNAQTVQVVGDFNEWDGRAHSMRVHPGVGVWELFIPDAKPGMCYKYRLRDAHGHWVDKCDPVGFAAELPPRTASIVSDLSTYTWQDSDWMERRREQDPLKSPMSVYEVHLGSWKTGGDRAHGWLDYRTLAHQLAEYCNELNFTHVELLPISEHPFTGSWGYQTVGYFAPTSRYGTPEDFMYFVDYMHQHGIGVILDWVPAHFPKDGHGLAKFDGTALYEHADPRQGEHPDWGTLVFNYKRNEVRNFLISNALFWYDQFHIDGLRVDAVASMLYLDYSREDGQWIPNEHGGRENIGAIELLREFNREVHWQYPGAVTIAEESTAWGGVSRPLETGGLGFTFKWNMGWMNDSLRYFRHDPIHRRYHHDELTFSLIYAFTENFVLPLSHDEVVHGKGALLSQMPGDMWQKFANLRLLYSYMWTHPGKNLLFMGSELGMWEEWNYERQIPWELLDFDTHRGVKQLIADLNRVVRENPALHYNDFGPEGFEWVDCMNHESSILCYLRKGDEKDPLVMVCANFTPVVHREYRVGVPTGGTWEEILNSDASSYDGSNVTNGDCEAEKIEHHARPYSIKVDLPPLGVSILRQKK